MALMTLAISTGVWAQPDRDIERETPPQPVRTATCLVEGKFSCQTHEYSYSVQHVTCTEDCLIISNLGSCRLNNRCDWDPDSGCFIKDVCVEINTMNNCRRWERVPICR